MVDVPCVIADGGAVPAYQTEGAAGADLRCLEAFSIAPMERRFVRTGVSVAIPPGYEGQVRPRSGLAIRHGITFVNSPGTIDCDYRGELTLIMINLGSEVVQFVAGDRVGQLVVCPVVRANFQVVDALDATDRGTGGFGSTGV